MQLKPGNFCPLLKKECVQMQCAWFIQVRGTDSNTGKEVDEWGCSVAWLPHMMIENANQSRQTGAAVESFRNEMVKANERTLMAMLSVPPPAQPKETKVITYDDTNKIDE